MFEFQLGPEIFNFHNKFLASLNSIRRCIMLLRPYELINSEYQLQFP